METAPALAPPATSWSLGLDHSVTVRPIRPEDADLELAFLRGLSPDSLYNRVFTARPGLTPAGLERLVRIDFSRDMAIIATVTLDGSETQIGVARYVRLADGTSAEFALTIADAWQGCGVGSRLLRELMAIARGAGIARMLGDVLSTNTAMIRLAAKLGMRIEPHPDGATMRSVVWDPDRLALPAATESVVRT